MLCSALIATYLSETKMDVSVRLLKHAFSPGRHSSGGNRFLAEIDRTEKRKQHPHLGPTSWTWLHALSWVFLLMFFNCCLLLLLIAPYSAGRRPWLKSLITFNTCPPYFKQLHDEMVALQYVCFFSFLHPQKKTQLIQHVFVGLLVKLLSIHFWSHSAQTHKELHLYCGRVASRFANVPRSDSIQLCLYHIIVQTCWCQLKEEMKRLLLTNQRWQE